MGKASYNRRRRRLNQGAGGGASSGGGAIDEMPDLIFVYRDANNNYSLDDDEWPASNDGGPLLNQSGYSFNADPAPDAISNNRIQFQNFGGLKPSQALLDTMNVDDLTVIFGSRITSGTGFIRLAAGGSDFLMQNNSSGTGILARTRRDSSFVSATTAGADTTNLSVVIGQFRRGGKVSVQLNSGTPVQSATDEADVALSMTADIADGFPHADGVTGRGEVGFIIAVARIITAEEITAILTELTGNALYGMAGYSPS